MSELTSNNVGPGEADSTLRLIAGLAAPVGLEDRVKAGLRRGSVRRTAELREWPLDVRRGWMQSTWMRGAAAAVIVGVVAGGSWGVYSRVQPRQAQIAIPRVGASSGFSSANAVRTPKTLDVPTVPLASNQKSVSGKAGKKAAEKRPGATRPVKPRADH